MARKTRHSEDEAVCGDVYYFLQGVLSRERISDPFANSSRKNYERARSTPPELEKPARNIGGEAANIGCLFFEFWRGGTRSLIVFLEDFAKGSLITARDNSCARSRIVLDFLGSNSRTLP